MGNLRKTQMRALTIISSFLILISCSETKKKHNDREKDELLGNVTQIKENKYEAFEKFGEISTGASCGNIMNNTLKKYNNQGNIKEEYYYNNDGTLHSKYIYEYDERGRLTEQSSFSANGNLEFKSTFKNDDKGNIIERIGTPSSPQFTSDGFRRTFVFDKNGNMIESCDYNSSGNLNSKAVNKFDNIGNLIEAREYNGDGSLWYINTFKYDSIGNVVEEINYDSKDSIQNRTTKKYNTNGIIAEKIIYRRSAEDNKIYQKDRWIFDSKGNEIEIYKVENGGVSKYSFKYEYDDNNNWVKKIEFINAYPIEKDVPRYITIREIQYN
jgi:hypothetical protein